YEFNLKANMIDISVKVSNYKCFKELPGGFDCIKNINLVIGRNNSGKSSILDLIEHLCRNSPDKFTAEAKIEFIQILQENELRNEFPEGTYTRGIIGDHWNNNGKHFVNKYAHFEVDSYFNNVKLLKVLDFNYEKGHSQLDAFRKSKLESTSIKKSKVLRDKTFRRILADRDIRSEPKTESLELAENGAGATNIIQRYITKHGLNRDFVNVILKDALNEIFEPDAHFNEIQVQMHDGVSYSNSTSNFVGLPTEDIPDKWEVFLGEEQKGLVALSKSGSGLKTVILVLLNLHLMPEIDKKPINDYIFAFEELENNLHPSLLRRLHKYLMDFALNNDCHIFLTTHSNVAIDQFAGNENAQIIHVKHDGEKATSETIDSHIGRGDLLDDLGTKASDILQSNGLVWLEGPSDRIYFNKWIEIFSDGELQEGRDYECIFYGGANLASYDVKDPLDEILLNEKINIININRNAILIGDSDRTYKRAPLKGRLAQLQAPMKEIGAYIWITNAKEIENYLPAEALQKHFKNNSLPKVELYEQFSYNPKSRKTKRARLKPKGYLQKHLKKKTERFDKVDLARGVSQYFTHENLIDSYELNDEMLKIIEVIKSWNER
ncbi:MAG: ATP-binding protein, partial [Lentisphaeraceae bacterium]|nr:ATP-binding protein [Lentisphaeraceae bacterium]